MVRSFVLKARPACSLRISADHAIDVCIPNHHRPAWCQVVRGADEYEIAHVKGVPLLPLSQLQERFTELDPNSRYYIHCKVGARSMKALLFLREQGFKYLKNVKGGITAWSEEIDSNVPRY